MLSVVIADDQVIVRDGLKTLIEKDDEIRVVGLAADGREAFEQCEKLGPDVVLMDLVMPKCNGIESTRLIKSKCPEVKVLILTIFSGEENTSGAMQNGADGYVLKDINPEVLISSIKNVAGGLTVMDQTVFSSIYRQRAGLEHGEKPPAARNNKKVFLTGKERQIIKLIVFGKNNKEIAAELALSEGRIRNVITGILGKLEVKDRTQLAVLAVKERIV